MANKDWASPSIPRVLYDDLEKYAKSYEGKRQGFTSGKDILVMLAREFMAKHRVESLADTTSRGKNIIIKDSKNSNYISLDVTDKKIICSDCQLDNCEHVTRVKSNKKLMKELEKYLVASEIPNVNDLKI